MPTAVIIGDSHVDGSYFGKKLEKKLQGAGFDVQRYGVGATSTGSWIGGNPSNKSKAVNTDDIPRGADLLLICLGTNDAANANRANKDMAKFALVVADRIAQLTAAFGAKRTIWILPPWLRGTTPWYDQESADFIYGGAAASGVELFDSRPSTRAFVESGDGDGVHTGSKGSEAWANAVMAQVLQPIEQGAGSLTTVAVLVGAGVAAWWLASRRRQSE